MFTISNETLRRITGLIQLAFGVLNGTIGLRFLLKLMASNRKNPFARLIYFITQPFLWMFQGLTRTPSFEGIEVEFYSLIGWIIVQLLWILFARIK